MFLIMLLGKIFVSVLCSSDTVSLVSVAAAQVLSPPPFVMEGAMQIFNRW